MSVKYNILPFQSPEENVDLNFFFFFVCRLVQTLSTALHRGGHLGGGDRSDGLLSLGALHLLLCFLKRFLGLHHAFGAALPGE